MVLAICISGYFYLLAHFSAQVRAIISAFWDDVSLGRVCAQIISF